jgi:hypothetical protein
VNLADGQNQIMSDLRALADAVESTRVTIGVIRSKQETILNLVSKDVTDLIRESHGRRPGISGDGSVIPPTTEQTEKRLCALETRMMDMHDGLQGILRRMHQLELGRAGGR